MFRNSNKQIYEIEAQINDIYYGKSGGGTGGSGSDFMSSNYGYTYKKNDDSSDAQMQYTTSKIDGIKMHFEDLESYFQKNQSDLEKNK